MSNTLLEHIDSPSDLKGLSPSQLVQLAEEIRQFLIESIAKTGGHFGANLGVVELTLALHKVFDSPRDRIIWDVGHQAYVHKILTGRKHLFHTLRKYRGLAGFPKRSESEHDAFGAGHASTSISAGLGMAVASYTKLTLPAKKKGEKTEFTYFFFFLIIRRPQRSTPLYSSAASCV